MKKIIVLAWHVFALIAIIDAIAMNDDTSLIMGFLFLVLGKLYLMDEK